MSYLAINLSQEVNGVSRLHGRVTQEMFSELWRGYTPDELHIGYVTNGVHFPTWVAPEALDLYNEAFGDDFLHHQSDLKRWHRIYKVEDKKIWAMRNTLRKKTIQHVKERLKLAILRKSEDPRFIKEVEENLRDDVLTIGFARRFATYKRAHLLFSDLGRLERIVNHPDRPVQFLFAGKAHPNDKAGQDLIRMIVEVSKKPQFIGKVIFLQNYDISLAQKLVQGVDIWMNTPTRPLEASGTSGEKAVMNGCLHFSVLDGWWAEGYEEGAGWALQEERAYDNQSYQDELDAEIIYSMLENGITQLFYDRDEHGVPQGWVEYIKNSIARVAPRFTMKRMLNDYEERFYSKLYARSRKMKANDFSLARELAVWKRIILRLWDEIEVVEFKHPDISKDSVNLGESYLAEIKLELGNLSSADIGVELVIPNYPSENGTYTYTKQFELVNQENGHTTYQVEMTPDRSGVFEYGIRIYPRHEDLPHRQDFALVKWA
jgi:phosphorylase/glycogen(starch) synthase